MTTQDDFLGVTNHLRTHTGDAEAWMRGLSPEDIATVTLWPVPDEQALAAVVAKIRTNHPGLFDPKTGAPISPTDQPATQQGETAGALRRAESGLAQQNSATAAVDLMVISAILNAHATNADGARALAALQHEIDDAVRSRTDLDTAAGARDFQRFLVGKLRQIGAIVESANLDDRSKASMATAWTALYESTQRVDAPPSAQPDRTPAPAGSDRQDPQPTELSPYGGDLAVDPFADILGDPYAGLEPAALPATQPVAPPQTTPPMPPAFSLPSPTVPAAAGGGSPAGLPGLPTRSALPRLDNDTGSTPIRRRTLDDLTLEDLLAAEEHAMGTDDAVDLDEAARDGAAPGDTDAPGPGEPTPAPSTEVRLPNGEHVTAPTPELAGVLRAALAGTPIGQAFHDQGITIPPPGTAVTNAVDPARISAGDVAMFTDRQALALDRTRALLDGEIKPVTSIGGPSFLGWLHPPQPAASTTPNAVASNGGVPPAPTRPAATAGSAR